MHLLEENPLLVLFLVVGFGAALGTIKVLGVSLGPAFALFLGLAVSAGDHEITIAPQIRDLGLILFTYTVGLASGPAFVAGMRKGGVRVVASVVGLVLALVGLVALASELLGLDAGQRAGLFSGASTNTPALSAALTKLGTTSSNPVVGYSLTYPFGVVAMIVVAAVVLNPRRSRGTAHGEVAIAERPVTVGWTVLVTKPDLPSLGALRRGLDEAIAFGRVEQNGNVEVATADVVLLPGDLVTVFGPKEVVEGFAAHAGERSDRHLALDRRSLDYRRMVVSNRHLAGKRLADLDLGPQFGATVTRIRRGDTDMVARDEMVVQLGDRLRVVAPRQRLGAVATYLGDSDRSLSEVDAIGFALGLAFGLLIGVVGVPLPGGGTVKLGAAGGTLVAGLVLGVVSRIGPITFQVPYSANLTLRQLGTLVFLAAVGISSGAAFADALHSNEGIRLLTAGAVLAASFAVLTLLVIQRVLPRGPVEESGLVAGIQTQPAVLSFATERTNGDDRVAAAYALALPIAMVAKILLIQLLI